VDGRILHFRLAGINNQNFIMRDEETGTWWQQISGKAILGPLKGRQLERVAFDEVSYALWKQENPRGLVLLADPKLEKKYAEADWEIRMLRNPTVTPVDSRDPLKPRDLVVGISVGEVDKAYPVQKLLTENPVTDALGRTPVLIVVGPDGRSVRCFERIVAGQTLDLFRKTGSSLFRLVDTQTGSEWDFSGKAVSGPLSGKSLPRMQTLKDYWFDWKLYHPRTSVYHAGELRRISGS